MANNQEYELKFTGEEIDERLELVSTIKDQVRQNIADIGGKFGSVAYEGGVIRFYDSDGGTQLGAVTITGTSYTVNVETNITSSNFTVLTSDEQSIITLTPTTKSMEFGSSVSEDYPEDYTFKLEVDSGSGYVDRTPEGNGIKQGGSASVDIRSFLRTGTNRVRIVVTGASSNQPRTLGYTVTLTSLSLSCNHPWHKVWVGGQEFAITNIFFGGNIAKTLHVKVGDTEYTKDYTASTSYDKVPTTFALTNNTPAESGVVPVELWMTGDGVETKHIYYNIMYVAIEDVGKVSMICTNKVKTDVYNFAEETLLEYAVYNVSELTSTVRASFKDTELTLLNSTQNVIPQTAYQLKMSLKIDTVETKGISLEVTLSSDRAEVSHTMNVDNSNAYLATEGYKFYFNSSLGNNDSADKEVIQNSSILEDENYKAVYPSVWTNFTFADDAWGLDSDGNIALVVKAGSELTVTDLKPLQFSNTKSATIEIMYRASNIADYDAPIITCIDTEEVTSNSVGFIIYPTRIVLLGTGVRQELFQQLPLSEDRIHHIGVVIQRGYAASALNLARIFINGCENVTFQFSGGNMFYNASGNNQLRLGQLSTDTYWYMMRIYDFALEASQMFNNYLNAVIETAEINRQGLREDNAIADGTSISYNLAKQAGFNRFVIETPNDAPIPSLSNPVSYSSGVNYHMEYNDNPEWNVSIYDAPNDRQGTTSSLYAMSNLRMKNKKEIRWVYHNLKDERGNVLEEIGKDGYIAGYGLNAKVSIITWKKNIASQTGGHKMAGTAMYNNGYKRVMGGADKLVADKILPTKDARVAVYQHPFLGFQKFSDGTYKFLGLYSGGPDKKDKKTFGYNETATYPSLMMIEGPNHDPYLTRFLVPWTDDVFYNASAETLSVGARAASDGAKQEGWDADIVADYSSDDSADEAAIQSLYEKEFKPAYDAIYYNSPYIASLAESGCTLSEINSNISEFQKSKTRGYSNTLMTFYNENYELVYYRVKTGKYEVLPKSTHDMLTYLGLSGSPTTSDIVTARNNNWLSAVSQFVNMREAYFSQVFKELFGVSDNDAKNTYWRKFLAVKINKETGKNEGGKWGFNEDDVDTLFQNDNNGQDTKTYFVEPDDTSSLGADIFQGRTSAFWYALRQNCKDQLKGMFHEYVDAMYAEAEELGLLAPTVHQTIFNLIDFYFWRKSSKYYPATAYNQDTQLAYIDVWFSDPDRTYNNVPPLTQIHGDHYETEREWVAKRIVYMFSKYQIGAFEAGNADGMGSLEFTPAEAFTMNVTPAIDLYPRVSYGGSVTENSQRTKAGDVCPLPLSASGTTGNYIKSMDWLSDLGDLTDLKLSPRSAADAAISFSVKGKRLRRLKVGDASKASSDIKFNASTLGVESEALEVLDARNVSTIEGSVSLQKCPRIREAYLSGTAVKSVIPPKGGRLLVLDLPDTVQDLILNELNLLQEEGLQLSETALGNIRNIYINSCNNINPVDLLQRIFNTEDNQLTAIGLIWKGWLVDQDGSIMRMFGEIAKKAGADGGYTGVDFTEDITPTSLPNISGALDASGLGGVYQEDIDAILLKLPNLLLNYDPSKLYMSFADPEVLRVLLANGVGDGTGITKEAAESVGSIKGWFNGNTVIEYFDEFEKFTGITLVGQYEWTGIGFNGCTALKTVSLPSTANALANACFYNTSSLEEVKGLEYIKKIGHSSYGGLTFYQSGIKEINLSSLEEIDGKSHFKNSKIKKVLSLGNISQLQGSTNSANGQFYGCTELETVVLPDELKLIGACCFQSCFSLSDINIPQSVEEIQGYAFHGTSSMNIDVVLPNLKTFTGNAIFKNSGIRSLDLRGSSVEVIPSTSNGHNGFCYGCVNLKELYLNEALREIQTESFSNCTSLEIEELNLPNLEILGQNAFYGVKIKKISNLGKITALPSSNVNTQNFGDKSVLEEVVLPNTLTSIPAYSFYNYTNMIIKDLNMQTLTSIGNSAFRNTKIENVSNLGSIITLGNGNSGGEGVFQDCTSLTRVVLPEGLTTIGGFAFNGCTSLSECNIPSTVTSIGINAFAGTALKRIIVPEGVTKINRYLCANCPQLELLDIPSTITNLEWHILRDSSETTLICRATTPPPADGEALRYSNLVNIYVPDHSVEAYKNASMWVNHANKIKPLSEYVEQ